MVLSLVGRIVALKTLARLIWTSFGCCELMVFILVEPTFEGNQGTEMTKLEGELCYKNCFVAAVKESMWKHDT